MRGASKVSAAMVAIVMTGLATTGAVGAEEPALGPNPLRIEPASGPVGTKVTVSGEDCGAPGQDIVLVFAGGGHGVPEGGSSLPEQLDPPFIKPDAEDRFTIDVVIPASLGTFHNGEGGPVVPGDYWFQTLPPGCTGGFTVTASPAPPPTAKPKASKPAPGPSVVKVRPHYTG